MVSLVLSKTGVFMKKLLLVAMLASLAVGFAGAKHAVDGTTVQPAVQGWQPQPRPGVITLDNKTGIDLHLMLWKDDNSLLAYVPLTDRARFEPMDARIKEAKTFSVIFSDKYGNVTGQVSHIPLKPGATYTITSELKVAQS